MKQVKTTCHFKACKTKHAIKVYKTFHVRDETFKAWTWIKEPCMDNVLGESIKIMNKIMGGLSK